MIDSMSIFNMWYWRDTNGSLHPYSATNQVIITRDRHAGKTMSKVTIDTGRSFTLNFIDLCQISDEDPMVKNSIVCITPVVGQLKTSFTQIPDNLVQVDTLQIIRLTPNSEEYISVATLCRQSMICKIISIKKIINPWLRSLFEVELRSVMNKNDNNPKIVYVKKLFHGTGSAKPNMIYRGEKGFMMQFAADGLWGRGTYFATQADYSDNYAYITKQQGTTTTKQIFLAEVIVGVSKQCPADATLRLPPVKEATQNTKLKFKGERYDSVAGVTAGGSVVYVVYDNNKAYPTYLITYESPAALHNT